MKYIKIILGFFSYFIFLFYYKINNFSNTRYRLRVLSYHDMEEKCHNLLENQYTPDSTIDVCNYKVKCYYNMYKESIEELHKLSNKLIP